MRLSLLLLCSVIFLSGCGNDAPDTATPEDSAPAVTPETETEPFVAYQNDRTFTPGKRIGMITATSTPQTIAADYGEENFVSDSIHLGEGYFIPGYRLFPDQAGELSVIFPGGEINLKDLQITIDAPDTTWYGRGTGIRIGTTLAELNELNGNPFELMGFDWDYGGVVTDWRGGNLEDYRIRLAYDYEGRRNEGIPMSIVGDKRIMSDLPELADIGVEVIQIIVRLPKGDPES
ncbi:hypothetical protein [Lewinella sp. W8]|uniref:hypothetical protein n=1 Tax=Lewinella sp. W8 TaxID=2528208 RepID=UPI0010688070|nr:hypothetical protein [Lewinella sp. W8]MTB50857.1 hypothetical protein [Lewinella sp. W8]